MNIFQLNIYNVSKLLSGLLDFCCLYDAEHSNGCLWNRFTSVQVTMAWCIVDCGDSDLSLCLLSCKSITLITEMMDKMTHTYLHNSHLWTQNFRIKNIQSMFTRNPELSNASTLSSSTSTKWANWSQVWWSTCPIPWFLCVCLFDAEYYNGCLWNRFTSVQVTMT